MVSLALGVLLLLLLPGTVLASDAGPTVTSTIPDTKGTAPAGGGSSWSTVAAFLAVVLFAGGFLGNLLASRRRRARRVSVYSVIRRRIEQERRGAEGGDPARHADPSAPT